MSLKEQIAIEALRKIVTLYCTKESFEIAQAALTSIDNMIQNAGAEVSAQNSINLSFEQVRTDLVECEMKLSKIKSILEDPNTDDYFALGQIMDLVGTKP